jgi:hypothetical protein
MANLATVLGNSGKISDTEKLRTTVFEVHLDQRGPMDLQTVQSMNNLARAMNDNE